MINSFVHNVLRFAFPCINEALLQVAGVASFLSQLKANKVSKSEGTRKVEYTRIIFESVLMLFTENYQKLVRACRNYNLLKLARFFETVYYV